MSMFSLCSSRPTSLKDKLTMQIKAVTVVQLKEPGHTNGSTFYRLKEMELEKYLKVGIIFADINVLLTL